MAAKSVIFVTGATGTVGQEVVKQLFLKENLKIKILVRDAAKAKNIFGQFQMASTTRLEYIIGEIERTDSYESHLAQSQRAFLLTPGGEAPGRFQEVEGPFTCPFIESHAYLIPEEYFLF